MKTPEQWREIVLKQTFEEMQRFNLIEEIQRDALNDHVYQLSDQRELELARCIASNERIRGDSLYDQMIKMRDKWHEARRYLRAANKGAERNNHVMRLQAQTINEFLRIERDKRNEANLRDGV